MKKTKIDWCDSTWNPVTGCYHVCEYCYARKMATRFAGFQPEENPDDWKFRRGGTIVELDGMQARERKDGKIVPAPYPFGFTPTLHRYKLDEPRFWKSPKNIFVCSMADLFGEWVPDDWIENVLRAAKEAPQHRYMFLTKNPARYKNIPTEWFDGIDAWLGTTVTSNAELHSGFSRIEAISDTWNKGLNWFVSVEPLLEEMDENSLEQIGCMHWVIIGAESGTRSEKVVPEKGWIDAIAAKCAEYGVPVFMKQSVKEIMGEDFRQEWPWEANNNG